MGGRTHFREKKVEKKVCLFNIRPCDNDKKEIEQESSLKISVRMGLDI